MNEDNTKELIYKDMDLEKEIEKWIDNNGITREDLSIYELKSAAKHFFELGLKVQKEE